MQELANRYLDHDRKISILDVGSYDVNGSYKPIFENVSNKYIGVDLNEGPNVDVVLKSHYRFPFSSSTFDLVISGQTFEHVELFWLTWKEMVRVTKPGGLIFLIAPSRGPEHRYPQDCWRFYPDGYRALAKYGNVEIVEVTTDWESHPSEDSGPWGDTVGAFRKPKRNSWLFNLMPSR
jgi:SAM-dependent methyltransferase